MSADTGLSAGADQKFDCLRRDIPSGVRFETTHALPPGHRLFFSSRFTKGYFLSSAAEDGYRALLQDHPYLEAKLAAAAGAILALATGIVVRRRAPPLSAPAVMTLQNFGARFRRELVTTYGFAIVMFALAIVPILNFSYSGHGGPSWLVAPFCFTWVVLRILVKMAVGTPESRLWYKAFCKVTVPSWLVVALPLSWAAANSIRMAFGLDVSLWSFYGMMVSPAPWFYFT